MHGGGLWSQLMTPDWPSALHWPVDTVWDGGYCRKTVGIMQQWKENNYSIFFLSQDIYRFIAVKMHVLLYFQVQTQQRHQTMCSVSVVSKQITECVFCCEASSAVRRISYGLVCLPTSHLWFSCVKVNVSSFCLFRGAWRRKGTNLCSKEKKCDF